MNESVYHRLREESWRRKLTAGEEAELRSWLEAHPEAAADWELESGLNTMLSRLPDVPVPGNFTARVTQAIEVAKDRPATSRQRWWNSFLPRIAFATLVLSAGLLAYRDYHEHTVTHQRELIKGVETVSGIASLPSPEILRDFEAIRRLNTAPPPDDELLALLK